MSFNVNVTTKWKRQLTILGVIKLFKMIWEEAEIKEAVPKKTILSKIYKGMLVVEKNHYCIVLLRFFFTVI